MDTRSLIRVAIIGAIAAILAQFLNRLIGKWV